MNPLPTCVGSTTVRLQDRTACGDKNQAVARGDFLKPGCPKKSDSPEPSSGAYTGPFPTLLFSHASGQCLDSCPWDERWASEFRKGRHWAQDTPDKLVLQYYENYNYKHDLEPHIFTGSTLVSRLSPALANIPLSSCLLISLSGTRHTYPLSICILYRMDHPHQRTMDCHWGITTFMHFSSEIKPRSDVPMGWVSAI